MAMAGLQAEAAKLAPFIKRDQRGCTDGASIGVYTDKDTDMDIDTQHVELQMTDQRTKDSPPKNQTPTCPEDLSGDEDEENIEGLTLTELLRPSMTAEELMITWR